MKNKNIVGLVVTLMEKPKMVFKSPEWENAEYEAKAYSERRNGIKDIIVIRMTGAAVGYKKDLPKLKPDVEIMVGGHMGSENVETTSKTEAKVKIFVQADFVRVNVPPADAQNEVHLEGNICKLPVFRKTAKSKMEITELIIAVNHESSVAFIPVICWKEVAETAATFKVGTRVIINGRLQSREYIKNISGQRYKLTAYEVSVKELGYEATITSESGTGAAQSGADGATQETSEQLQEYGA